MFTPKMNTMLYVNYISPHKKNPKQKPKHRSRPEGTLIGQIWDNLNAKKINDDNRL